MSVDQESNSVTKRVNKVLESRIENDKETLVALKELTKYFPENTIQSRRNLRSKIEKRSLSINEFRKVKEYLDNIESDVKSMSDAVGNMALQLNATKAQTHQLIEQTSKLQSENKKLSMQEQVAGAFIKTFQLSQHELDVLNEGEISLEFFKVLDRVTEIHENCTSCLSEPGLEYTSSLEISQQMSLYKENGLERLYRWALMHCKNLEPATSQLLAMSMAKLQDSPTLFRNIVASYCTHRRSVLVRQFLDALTKESHGKEPIEMYAHDPHRYISAMLTFLHQSVTAECPTLFKLCDKIDVNEEMQGTLANISEGVVTPLRVRIEQVASTELPLKTLYSIANLLCYTKEIISLELGEQGLAQGLKEMENWCLNKFLDRLSSVVKKEVIERVSVPPCGLNPSPGIESLLALLRDLLANQHRQHMNQIVACVLDPLLQAVNVSASRLDTADMAVYLLNCLYMMQNTVTLYEFMDDRVERLQAQCDAQIDALTSEQASSLVANLNLSPVYNILQQEQGKGVMLSTIPGMQTAALNNFICKFENYLAMPDLLTLPQVECLLSGSHRSQVLRRSTDVILAIYKQLYNCVHNSENGYQEPEKLLPRDPENVSSILKQKLGGSVVS